MGEIMSAAIIYIINFILLIITVIIIAKVFLSYFMDPYQPVRLFIDRIVDPMLRPIQRIIPPVGGLDISPLVLLLIVNILGRLIIGIISTLFH
jgi:YggT family protein